MTEAQTAATLHQAIAEVIAPRPVVAAEWRAERTRLRGPYYIRRPAVLLRTEDAEIQLEVCAGAGRMEVTARNILGASLIAVYVTLLPAQQVSPEAAARLSAAHAVRIMREVCDLFSVLPPGEALTYQLCMELP